ncbi:hypothetical protein CL618_01230 [archaeon]|nr:hypothetical protein [archaeon]
MRILSIALILILVASLPFVSAIKGTIGNAKMILREDVGVEIDKSILVINDNDGDVTINLEVLDIQDIVTLNEDNFVLEAGEEKNAGFIVKADEEGLYNGKIIVKFSSDDGNVAVASNVILITSGYSNTNNDPDDTEPDDTNPDNTNPDDNNDPVNNNDDSDDDDDDDKDENKKEIPRGLIDTFKDLVKEKEIIDITGDVVKKEEVNSRTGILIATSIILLGLIFATLFLIKEGDKSKGEGKSKK